MYKSSHVVATLQAILNWVIAEYKKSRKGTKEEKERKKWVAVECRY